MLTIHSSYRKFWTNMSSQIRRRSNVLCESFALSVKRGQSWWLVVDTQDIFSHLTSRGRCCTHQRSYFSWDLPHLLTSHPSCPCLFLAKVCDKNQIFPACVSSLIVFSWVGHFSSRPFLTPIFKLLLSSVTSFLSCSRAFSQDRAPAILLFSHAPEASPSAGGTLSP